MADAHVSINTTGPLHRTITNLLPDCPSQWRLLYHGCGQLGLPDRATPFCVLQPVFLALTAASPA